MLHIRALMAQGQLREAHTVTTNAMAKLASSVRVRWAAHEVFHFTNDPKGATNALAEINRLAGIPQLGVPECSGSDRTRPHRAEAGCRPQAGAR